MDSGPGISSGNRQDAEPLISSQSSVRVSTTRASRWSQPGQRRTVPGSAEEGALLGERRRGAAAGAGDHRRGEVDAEDLLEGAGGSVAVEGAVGGRVASAHVRLLTVRSVRRGWSCWCSRGRAAGRWCARRSRSGRTRRPAVRRPAASAGGVAEVGLGDPARAADGTGGRRPGVDDVDQQSVLGGAAVELVGVHHLVGVAHRVHQPERCPAAEAGALADHRHQGYDAGPAAHQQDRLLDRCLGRRATRRTSRRSGRGPRAGRRAPCPPRGTARPRRRGPAGR